MNKRSKVKVRKAFRKTKAVINELGNGAGYALRN
tara:strand:- start:142 stop:243 length:102 start_codon:yes stop_codon:yes gene_type:complete